MEKDNLELIGLLDAFESGAPMEVKYLGDMEWSNLDWPRTGMALSKMEALITSGGARFRVKGKEGRAC